MGVIPKPHPNAEVDFEPNEDKAIEVYILTKDTDDIKNLASSAANTTVTAAKAITSTIKKFIPILILIAVLGGIVVFISEVVNPHFEQIEAENEWEKANAQFESKSKKANKLFKNKQYKIALNEYEQLIREAENNYAWGRYKLYFQFKTVECLLELKNSIRAQAMLEKVDISDSITNDFGEQVDNKVDDKVKAKFYILKAKINRLNNDYKPTGGQFSIFDRDYYSANAEEACKYGDCSLIKK